MSPIIAILLLTSIVSADPPDAHQEIKRLAIIELADLGPSVELAPLRFALAEMLTTELSGYSGLKLAERIAVEDLLREKDLSKGALVDPKSKETPSQIAADFLLDGTFSGHDGLVTVNLQLRPIGGATPLLEEKWTGKTDELPKIAQTFASRVRKSLDINDARSPAVAVPNGQSKPTVAIFGFRNLSPSGADADLVDALPDLLQTSLSVIPDINLVDRTRLMDVLREQKLSLSGMIDVQSQLLIGKMLGAQKLVFGSVVHLGDEYRVDVRLTDTANASVSFAAHASRSKDKFPELLEELTTKLSGALALKLTPQTEEAIHSVAPSANVEVQVHLSRAERSFRENRPKDALMYFERALLLEPKNLTALEGRLDVLMRAREYAKEVEAATQAFNQDFKPSETILRRRIAVKLAEAYWLNNQHEEMAVLCRKMLDEPGGRVAPYSFRLIDLLNYYDLLKGNKVGQELEKLERAYSEAKKKGGYYVESGALLQLFVAWYEFAPYKVPERSRPPELRRKRIERLKELFDEVLQHATKPNVIWSRWQSNAVAYAIYYSVYPEDRELELGFTAAEEESRILATMKTFDWNFDVKYHCLEWLAPRMAAMKRPAEALEYYRQMEAMLSSAKSEAENEVETKPLLWRVPKIFSVVKSDATNTSYHLPNLETEHSTADSRYSGPHFLRRVRIALLENIVKEDKEKLKANLSQLALEHGLVCPEGLYVAQELAKVGGALQSDAPLALIWGGGDASARVWNEWMQSYGGHAHQVNLPYVTAADLEPYSLLVLERHGGVAITPQGILAIRSFVARGGSLLVIPEPGFDPAITGVINPLLAIFGVRAEGNMIAEAKGTISTDHPITHGFKNATATYAAPLTMLPNSSLTTLVESSDGNLLMAGEYRRGRVVIASFGQWWLPDFKAKEKKASGWDHNRSNSRDINSMPFEVGPRLEPDLLKSVVAWLMEPAIEKKTVPFEEQYARVQQFSREVMLGVRPEAELRDAADQLVSAAHGSDSGEEALWVAALAFDPCYWVGQFDNTMRRLGLPEDHTYRLQTPEYYDRLVKEYPESELLPYAKFFLAETKRRVAITRSFYVARNRGRYTNSFNSVEDSLTWFSQLTPTKGSYLWAWRQIRLAQQYFAIGKYKECTDSVHEVAEVMTNGPEKLLAVHLLIESARATKDKATAERYAKIASEMPQVGWPSADPIIAWARLMDSKEPHFDVDWLDGHDFGRLIRDIRKE